MTNKKVCLEVEKKLRKKRWECQTQTLPDYQKAPCPDPSSPGWEAGPGIKLVETCPQRPSLSLQLIWTLPGGQMGRPSPFFPPCAKGKRRINENLRRLFRLPGPPLLPSWMGVKEPDRVSFSFSCLLEIISWQRILVLRVKMLSLEPHPQVKWTLRVIHSFFFLWRLPLHPPFHLHHQAMENEFGENKESIKKNI